MHACNRLVTLSKIFSARGKEDPIVTFQNMSMGYEKGQRMLITSKLVQGNAGCLPPRGTCKLLRPMITCISGSSFHLKFRKMNRCLEISIPKTLGYYEFYVAKKGHGDLVNLILESKK